MQKAEQAPFMTTSIQTVKKLQLFLTAQLARITASESYRKLMSLPPVQRWASVAGLFLLSQAIVFGGLYVIFGKIVVIGFLASILAGLATGVGALPALFFRNI